MLPRLAALLLVPGMALAQDWQAMDGAAIEEALTGQTLLYDNATQRFFPSGRTLYDAGQESWGYWTVRGDQYCSQWPPSDQWECYDMARSVGAVRFIGADGSTTAGMIAE